MKIFVLLLIALVSAINYDEWKLKHSKVYSRSEDIRRRAIFSHNAKLVNRFNSNKKTFKLSLNGPFADITNQEYRKLLTYKSNRANEEDVKLFVGEAPEAIDWRDYNKVPPVRDQGSCGSCWAFSTIFGLESGYLMKYGGDSNIDFSEQQLVDCSSEYGNNGCNGGDLPRTFKYIAAVGGVQEEKTYPYTEKDGNCVADSSLFVATCTGSTTVKRADEEQLKLAAAESPLSICIDAGQFSFQLYSGGVYDEPKCSNNYLGLNHCVGLIGYGIEDGVEYWLVRNSWGTSWGEAGYIKMIRNSNNQCGIASEGTVVQGVSKV